MLDSEIMQAVEMRLKGKTWERIAESLHYSRSNVMDCVHSAVLKGRKTRIVESSAYPKLAEYVTTHYRGCIEDFAKDCGLKGGAISSILRGKYRPTEGVLGKIRCVAGNVV